MSTAQSSGLAIGLNKGFRIVKRAAPVRARDTRKAVSCRCRLDLNYNIKIIFITHYSYYLAIE